MKFALINGERHEPTPGSAGTCPGCGQEVLAKCGTVRIWHWAHKGKRSCDPWWEPETLWHRTWKNLFPAEWQEVPMRAPDGELHIADVRTPQGLVIEFQHSAIKQEERTSRESFYQNMVWVVDGTRLKRDRPRINENRRGWRNLEENFVELTRWPSEFLPANWLNASTPVLFDFDGLTRQEDYVEERDSEPPSVLRDDAWWNSRGACPDPLICLLPKRYNDHALYFPINRLRFIKVVNEETKVFDYRLVHQRLMERDAELAVKFRGRRNRF